MLWQNHSQTLIMATIVWCKIFIQSFQRVKFIGYHSPFTVYYYLTKPKYGSAIWRNQSPSGDSIGKQWQICAGIGKNTHKANIQKKIHKRLRQANWTNGKESGESSMLLDIPIHMHTHAEWLSVELENKAQKNWKSFLSSLVMFVSLNCLLSGMLRFFWQVLACQESSIGNCAIDYTIIEHIPKDQSHMK